jgi:hypothetical protein
MLTDKIKTQIRTIYKGLAAAMPNFRSRREQNFMVAEISKTLAGEYDKDRRIIVVEAGTGIGKSLSPPQPLHCKSSCYIKTCLFFYNIPVLILSLVWQKGASAMCAWQN